MADRSYLAGLIPPPTAGATVNSNLNLFDLPPEGFRSYLNELAAQGVNTDELMRQYRRANSPFSGLFDWAINSERDIANEGRTTAGAGLLSKEAGTTGMDALASARIEPANFIAGLLSGGAQAVDAPAAAAQGLLPAADMPMEALGTAGMAMTGGAAAPRPAGSVGMGGRLYRVERETYENPGEGAVYYSPDRQYVENYKSPDRVLRQASIPENVIDTTTQDGRASVQSWLLRELDRYKQKEEVGQIRGRADMRDLERILAKDELSFEDTSRALALLDVLDASELGRIPVGASQRRFMDVAGVDAMTIRESDGSLSYAFRSPETAQAYQIGGELSANRDATTGAIALPAARNEAERMARQILEMRSAGRAGEVTDAMMAQADPQYMFNNTPLPMDEASRMARAAGRRDEFHGTTTGSDMTYASAFRGSGSRQGIGFVTSDNPYVASSYADPQFGSVFPMLNEAPPVNAPRLDVGGEIWSQIPKDLPVRVGDRVITAQDVAVAPADVGGVFDTNQLSRGASFDYPAIEFSNISDRSIHAPRPRTDDGMAVMREFQDKGAEPSTVTMRHDARGIRSRFARFDPEFSHLANLNAANASPLAGILAMPNEEERNRQLGLLFGGYR